jgi:hypothetical protein
VARRRYRSDALNAAGHGERPADPASEPSPPPAPDQAEAKPESVSSLKEQIAQQRAYASDPVEQYISFHFPGALVSERAWLRNNPHHLANPALIHSAAAIALQRGCPRGSPEFMQFCGALLDQHAAAQGHAAPLPAEPMPPPVHEPMPAPPTPEPVHEPVTIDLEKTEGPEGEPDEAHHMASFISAPVSRGTDRYAVEPEPTLGTVRLTAEQRDMAHRSMPHLSADQAEKNYAANLIKMQKMQKSGLIK